LAASCLAALWFHQSSEATRADRAVVPPVCVAVAHKSLCGSVSSRGDRPSLSYLHFAPFTIKETFEGQTTLMLLHFFETAIYVSVDCRTS